MSAATENPRDERAQHTGADAETWRPAVNPWLIALAVMLATFMEVLDTSIASVALPYISGNLGATQHEATWTLTSYLVANAIVLPVSAWFSRVFGRKRFLIVCIGIFTFSSFLCGAATNLPMLVIARVLQGAGGGALQPLAQAILLESFPPAKRGIAMAVYGVGVVCAPIIGPTLGGWLTDSYSWRWAFYINIPVGILAVFLISAFVEDPPYVRAAKPGRIDGIGFGLLAIWLATLQITLDKGQEVDWFETPWLRWTAIVSAVAFVLFVIRELVTEHPIVDLRVLKDRNFAVGCTVFALFGAVIYGLITLQPLLLQTLMGYTAFDAGLTVSPRGAGSLCALFLVGFLARKVNGKILVSFGFAVFGVSAFMLSRINLDVAMRNIIPANVVNGFGTGFIFVPLTGLALGTLRNEQLANATGIQNLVRNIGGGIGISFITTMLERYAQAHQVILSAQMSPLRPEFQQQLALTQRMFESSFSPADALVHAQATLYRMMLQQASYWAFVQIFFAIACLCGLCVLGVLFFKRVKSTGAVALH